MSVERDARLVVALVLGPGRSGDCERVDFAFVTL
jgi:hypothetical protein